MFNLLSSYIARKGFEAMSSYGGNSYSDFDTSIAKPSRKKVQETLAKQENNVALANYIKNLHTSMWDHCSRSRRKPSDDKVQKIVLKHCRKNGMTKKQQNEVEKLAKANMNKTKPWRREVETSRYSTKRNIRMVIFPDHFTLQQKQYLCACMREYGMDTLVLANKNGKEAHIMTFHAEFSYIGLNKNQVLKYSFPSTKVEAELTELGGGFCRPYRSDFVYAEIHLNTKDNVKMNLDAFKLVVEEMAQVGFQHSYCQLPEGMNLFEENVPQKEEVIIAGINGGDDVLNGQENLSVPNTHENISKEEVK